MKKLIFASLFIIVSSSSFAKFDKEDYIFEYDSERTVIQKKELKKDKNDLKRATEDLERTNFKLAQDARKRGVLSARLAATDNEFVYKVDDTRKKDIGAKNGMTPSQVLNNTYWGKPDLVLKTSDELGSFEQWSYYGYGKLYFTNGKLATIFITDSPKIREKAIIQNIN